MVVEQIVERVVEHRETDRSSPNNHRKSSSLLGFQIVLWGLLTLLGVAVLGGLLAPGLFWAGRLLVAHDVLPALAPFGFYTYFNRSLMLAALLAFAWGFRRMPGPGGRRWTWRALLLGDEDKHLSKNHRRICWGFALGLALGFLGVLLLVKIALVQGWTLPGRHYSLQAMMLAVLAALSVAVFEEIIFRRLLPTAFGAGFSATVAGGISSFIFAGMHFIRVPHGPGFGGDDLDWASGLLALPHLWDKFWHMSTGSGPWWQQEGIASFASLWALGAVLARLTHRWGGIALAVGVHAAYILGAKWLVLATYRRPDLALFWGSTPYIGWGVLGAMLATWFVAEVGSRWRKGATWFN